MRAKTSTVEGFTSNIITLVRYARQNWLSLGMYEYKIDPSAGSPTETLLRLLLPLSSQVHSNFAIARQSKEVHQITRNW
jgi:hypothetical protein